MSANRSSTSRSKWPFGDSEMARRIRETNWDETPLGPMEGWPRVLRTTLDLMLPAGMQIVLFWGPEYIAFYNDAYAPTIGNKHPRALGRPAVEHWKELWDDLEPLLGSVRATGETLFAKDRPFYMERSGYGEQVYFDISYSAVRDETGSVGGVLCIVNETTERVMAERALRESEERQRFLLELGDRMRTETDADAIIATAARMLGERLDAFRVVFAEIDDNAGVANMRPGWRADTTDLHPSQIKLADFSGPLLDDLRAGRTIRCDDVALSPSERSDVAAFAAHGIRAFLGVPLIVAGRFVVTLGVQDVRPRHWTDFEVALVEEVAGRVWADVDRARAEHAMRQSEERFRNMADNISQLAWTCDELGSVTWYNERWLEYTGRSFEEMKDWGWMTVLQPEHRDHVFASIVHSRECGVPWEDTFPLRGHDGTYRWFLSRAIPIRNTTGAIIRWFGTNTDITDERGAEAARAQLAAIVESSHDAIVSKDLNGVIMSWNEGARSMFGYSADEIVGRPITVIIPSDRQDEEVEILAKIGRGEHIEHFETRRQRKDGSTFDVSLTISPVKDRQGRIIGVSKIARDITERKRAQETQDLLIGELNHRVKNTLASVQAIAQQTLRRTRDPESFVTSFAGRIQSLARVHTLLAATTWRSADLRDLVRDQILHGAIDEARVSILGPQVQLEPQTALHLALILHELGTNAVKYGALSTSGGWVTVKWTVENGSLNLVWEERGGPPVRITNKLGFGSTLIQQSAKGEGGSALMRVDAEGVTWAIAMPFAQLAFDERLGAPAEDTARSRLGLSEAQSAPGRLSGQRFLIVEDEPLVALDLTDTLEGAGAEVVATAASSKEAIDRIEAVQIDAALLDGNLHGQPVDEIAAALTRRNVPFLFVSGYGREGLPQAFRDAPLLGKPFSPAQLVEAAAGLITRGSGVISLRDIQRRT